MNVVTMGDAVTAIDFVIQDWRERQIDSLNALTYTQLEDNDFLKRLAWANFGVDAAKTLFPRSATTQLINNASTRLAVPIWIISQAMAGFDSLQRLAIEEKQEELNQGYDCLRNGFIRRIQEISRRFIASELGRNIADQLIKHSSASRRVTRDSRDLQVYLRDLLVFSGLIETDQTVLSARTQQGFGHLCVKIMQINFGTYHDFGHNKLIIRGDTLYVDGFRGTYRDDREVETKEEQDHVLANAWQYEVISVFDVPWFIKPERTIDYDRTYIKKINDYDTPFRLAETFRGGAADFEKAEKKIAHTDAPEGSADH